MKRYDPWMDAMRDSALMAGTSAVAFAPDSSTNAGSALTIQSVTEFLADHPEVTRYVLMGFIDENLIEFLRIGILGKLEADPDEAARDVEEATEGVIDAKTCHNWTARHQWITPQGPNPRGKVRRYSLMHLIEAAFREELVALGLSHELARQAAASAFEAGIAQQIYPLLNVVNEKTDTFWVVQFQTDQQDQPDRRPIGRFINAQGARSTADAFEPLRELAAATIFNVTAVGRK